MYKDLISTSGEINPGKRLLIIPDRKLGFLSFDILLTDLQTNSRMDYNNLPYLILRNPISYSSSATIFYRGLKQHKIPVSDKLLAFAPSYDGKLNDLQMIREIPGDSSGIRLMPIPGVEEEVTSIMKIFSGRMYMADKATESNFKDKAGHYDILHLAMHTLIDNQNPLNSRLIFSPDPDTTQDGMLSAYELFSLDLNGSLVVLSACNTGSGKLEHGEGIISLARGFIYAGVPSIIMTLWEVEDHSSAVLMTSFYRNLHDGLPKDVALQKAKIDYLRIADPLKSHPYFWAGFVNIGQTSPVPVKTGMHAGLAIILLLVIILGAIIVINIRVYFRKKTD